MAAAAGGAAQPVCVMVRAKDSASMLPNNLSVSKRFIAYAHKKTAAIVENKHSSIMSNKLNPARAAHKDVQDRITQVRFCTVSSLGEILVVVFASGLIEVYDETGQKMLHHQKVPETELCGIAGEGHFLYVGCNSGNVLVLQVSADKLRVDRILKEHKDPVLDVRTNSAIANTPYHLLATADENGTIFGFNIDNEWQRVFRFDGGGQPCTSLAISRRHLIAAYASGHIRFFGLETFDLQVEVAAHSRVITGLDYHVASNSLVSCSEDTFVMLWHPPKSDQEKLLRGPAMRTQSALLTGVQFCGNAGSLLVCSVYDSSVLRVFQL